MPFGNRLPQGERVYGDLIAVTSAMTAYPGRWAIAGGWAVDLAIGHQTRGHDDIEVAVLRDDLAELHRTFAGDWQMVRPHPAGLTDAGRYVPWDGQPLHLPIHQVSTRQHGVLLSFLLNERRDDRWVFRRDTRIDRPLDQVFVEGPMPRLALEVALLFKAKHRRPKDEADFDVAAEHLTAEAQTWLAAAMAIAHPGHRWIERLDS